MSKYVLIFLLLLIATTALCQKKSKVNLISSTKSEGVKRNGVDVIKVYNGVWRQDYSIMRSDSAYFHQAQNSFEAFGHVNINQGDTLNIYSDKLNYDGNTKIAILTNNVKMVDKDATLTTNYFTYSTATRIGTYTDGGKLVNKGNTLTSRNGYYFASSRDAYFRYNVVCTTADALINTDTMRYNAKTRINYFYGPTHIYGIKDKDTLDTDFGTYDTNTEQAFFTKKNLYRQGTKSLKGDTLFYDRLKGFGRAVKHVTFIDNEQKITIKGGLGTYFKSNDLTIVTRDPYVILVTEDKDTTSKTIVTNSDSALAVKPKRKPGLPPKKPVIQSLNNLPATTGLAIAKAEDSLNRRLTMPVIDTIRGIVKSNADTIGKLIAVQHKKLNRAAQKQIKNIPPVDTDTTLAGRRLTPNGAKVKRDSVYMSADTIETRILTFKELNTLQETERRSHIKDTSKVRLLPPVVYKKAPKVLSIAGLTLPQDTSYLHRNYFGPPKPAAKKVKKNIASDKIKKNVRIDSTFLTRKVILSDTARVRILMAFHSAKVFKSDLQAKADSMFYSNSDSTIRCYVNPMIWTQGAQLSGDTINLQMRNKKLDNLHMFPSSFIIYLENADSTHFNQIGGKQMRGFFKDDKLSKVYVEGNVESIYFVRDSTTKQITDMQRSFSSRMNVFLKNNEVTDVAFLTKPDHRYIPIHVVKEDEKILKGFIWRPKDRPVSKESIIPSYNKKTDTVKTHLAGSVRPKKMYSDKAAIKPNVSGTKAAKDSTGTRSTAIKEAHAAAIKAPAATAKDSAMLKPAVPVIRPVKMKKDSTGNNP